MTKSYKLGNFCFQIKSSDEHLSNCIGTLLEQYNIDVNEDPLSLIDIDLPLDIVPGWDEIVSEASGLEIIRLIVRRALNYHQNFLWFDAATVVTPSGKLLLLAGPSHSGKSTAATALAFGYNWKLLAEDVSLVDPATQTVISFSSPLSLRPGSLERIKQATGVLPGPVIGSEWIPITDHLHPEPLPFRVDLAVTFEVTDGSIERELQVINAKPAQLMHSLLPLCNAMHLDNGIDLLHEGIQNASCLRIAGGRLQDRLACIANALGEKLSN